MSYQIDSIFQILNPDNTLYANRFLAHAIGMAETIIYSALISKFTYYSGKGMVTEDGWFYSTVYDLQESTTYGEKPQKSAVKHLVDCGLIEVKVMGLPARRYFRICNCFDRLNEFIRKGSENAKEIVEKHKSKNAEKSQISKMAYHSSSSQMAELENPLENHAESPEHSSSSQTAELLPPIEQNKQLPSGETGSDLSAEHIYNHNLKKRNFMNHNLINPPTQKTEKREYNFSDKIDMIDEIDFANAKKIVESQIGEYTYSEELKELTEVMIWVYTTKEKYLRVRKQSVSIETVRERFHQLEEKHLRYVLECVESVGEPTHRFNYFLTSLYNAPLTIDAYYKQKSRTNKGKKRGIVHGDIIKEQEMQEIDKYLDLVNPFDVQDNSAKAYEHIKQQLGEIADTRQFEEFSKFVNAMHVVYTTVTPDIIINGTKMDTAHVKEQFKKLEKRHLSLAQKHEKECFTEYDCISVLYNVLEAEKKVRLQMNTLADSEEFRELIETMIFVYVTNKDKIFIYDSDISIEKIRERFCQLEEKHLRYVKKLKITGTSLCITYLYRALEDVKHSEERNSEPIEDYQEFIKRVFGKDTALNSEQKNSPSENVPISEENKSLTEIIRKKREKTNLNLKLKKIA